MAAPDVELSVDYSVEIFLNKLDWVSRKEEQTTVVEAFVENKDVFQDSYSHPLPASRGILVRTHR